MALLFCDSWDHYSISQISRKWSQFSGSAGSRTFIGAYGRNGTSGLSLSGVSASPDYVAKNVNNKATVIIGFAFQATGSFTGSTAAGTSDLIVLNEGGLGQISVRVTATGRLAVVKGGTVLATGTHDIMVGVFYYIEFKVTINSSTGAFEVRVNESTDSSASGVNTQNTANAYTDNIQIKSATEATSNPRYFDDFYLCDNSGAANNDFLGDVRVQCLIPNGAGATTGWTPLSGANWQNVNEEPIDDEVTYVSTGAAGTIDTYTMTDLAATTGSVKGVQTVLSARKDDSGTRTLAPVFHIAASDYVGSNQNIGTTYAMYLQEYDTSPATGIAWTVSEVNGAQLGQKLVA